MGAEPKLKRLAAYLSQPTVPRCPAGEGSGLSDQSPPGIRPRQPSPELVAEPKPEPLARSIPGFARADWFRGRDRGEGNPSTRRSEWGWRPTSRRPGSLRSRTQAPGSVSEGGAFFVAPFLYARRRAPLLAAACPEPNFGVIGSPSVKRGTP